MKLIKIKLNILINSKELKQTLNLTTILGQQGINLLKFNTTVDPILNVLKYKLPLNFQLKVFTDKTFDIFLKNYNFNFLFKHFIFFKKKYSLFENYEIDDTVFLNTTFESHLNLSDDFLTFKYNYLKIQITPFDLFVFHTVFKVLEEDNLKNFSIFYSHLKNFKKIINQVKTCYGSFIVQ